MDGVRNALNLSPTQIAALSVYVLTENVKPDLRQNENLWFTPVFILDPVVRVMVQTIVVCVLKEYRRGVDK